MPEIIYYVAASIDGYIATPDGGIEWLGDYEKAGEDYGYADFYRSINAVLLGSKTYEQALTFGDWPYSDRPCWVFSARQLDSRIPNVTITSKSPAEAVRELHDRGIKRAWLVGGGGLAASFRTEGLISEYIVSFIPVILGQGIQLFSAPAPQERLKLASSRSYPNGVVQLSYVKI